MESKNSFYKRLPSATSPDSLRNTLLVSTGTLLSRLLGFVRDASIAWLLGGTGTADALTAALRIPYMARRMFGEGTLSLSLTTACTKEALHGGSGCGLALAVMRRLALWMGLLTLLLVVGASGLLLITAPGLAERPQILDNAATLFRLCAPYLWCSMLAAGCMAALHSRQHFLLPSLTTSLFNLCMLASAGFAFLSPRYDTGILLACGVLCGGLAQWLVILPAVHRLRREEPPKPPKQKLIAFTLRRIPLGILGAALPQVAFLIASALASMLPEGHIAALFYAERLLEFPLGVLGAAVGMSAAPRLAALVAAPPQNLPSPLACEINRALLLALGLNLPAAAGLAAVSAPLVAVTLGHGAFDSRMVADTALALCAYAPGLPAYALSRPLLATCHALENNVPLQAAGLSLLVTLAAGWGLMQTLGAWGPPLGVSLGLWCNAALLWQGVRREVSLSVPLRSLLVQGVGTLATFATAFACVCLLETTTAQLLTAVPVGAATYALTVLLGDRTLVQALKTKRRPKLA